MPAGVCLSSLLVKTTSTQKAIGLAVFRSFSSPFLVAGVLFLVAGFGFAKVASITHTELVARTGRKQTRGGSVPAT